MRKLVLLVCMFLISLGAEDLSAGVIPSFDSPSGQIGFHPITNEISFFQNNEDNGANRGQTIQIVSINNFKLLTSFNFEFTGDFNFGYTWGLKRDHYVELSIVKPLNSLISLNVQRIISTFEPESINQFGIRLCL
jgi:hypothetical protein